ncbi:MAG: hypothetical protein H8J66_07945 [Nitrospira sp.]|nr:hypothetical protein [Nitrospira sp.]
MQSHSWGSKPAPSQRVFSVMAVLVGLLVGGCHWSPAASSPVSHQLMVKFAPRTIACTADGIAEWSVVTHVRLTYVRSMSGDACVLIQWAESAAELAQGEALLRRDPAIEWIEDDRVLQPL